MAAILKGFDGTNVTVQRKDRFIDPANHTFPSARIMVSSQGIKMPNTSSGGYILRDRGGVNGDVRGWYGGWYRGVATITIEVMSETSGTDNEILGTLDDLVYQIAQYIEIDRLGLYFPDDYIKTIPGSEKVTYLPEFYWFDDYIHRWIYRCNIDFGFMYIFSEIDPTPNIHFIDYDFGIPMPPQEQAHLDESVSCPPWYHMDILLKGWGVPHPMGMYVKKAKESAVSMRINIIRR